MSLTATLAVDCHLRAHWPQRYPYQGTRSQIYNRRVIIEESNIAASAEALFPTLSTNGVTHALIVQPGSYATDNSAMLDVIAGSQGRAKGIAVIALDASDDDFADLKRGGIVRVRLSLITWDSEMFERPHIGSFLERCRRHDFYVEVFAGAAEWPTIMPKLLDSGVRVMVNHMGWPNVTEGTHHPSFQSMLQFGRLTDALVKIACGFRLTQIGEPYDDVRPFVTEVVDAFGPDRCVWGSDWPLLDPDLGPLKRSFPWKLDYSTELNSLSSWIPDEAVRRAILWETPARLFGFSAPEV